ncbi:MAG: aldo/keto reductase [Bacteroidales bacterium]|nr:aldo/keto reductase [Bacteroidales bacterium]
MLKTYYELNNGCAIPAVGFGTWQSEPEKTAAAVQKAIECGFRHIDTAAFYHNEKEVGEGVRRAMETCGLKREDIFVTTKIWNSERGFGRACRSIENSLLELNLEYIDLLLIHWPAVPTQYECWKELNLETWRAMEKYVKEGKVRSIGVSNFMPRHLEPLLEKVEIMPAVNQIEFHPGWMQPECVDFCKEREILVEAWSPLANGDALKCEALISMAEKYGVSVSQLVLNWVAASGVIPLSKSVTPARIEENAHSFDFAISDEDLDAISALTGVGGKCRNPDLVLY